ncbi:MAG TPA: rhomboid family intramembrane serine protease, partial [Hanamia sp.]|nr:rhomboid family intramembrane serine protease [Hanamia sp.]
MGESERYLDRRLKKITLGDDNNALMALVAINVMIFISLGLIQVIYYMTQSSNSAFQYEILKWFILPAKLNTLAIMPWTVLSYMFVHTGFIYTLVNMLWLWAFGSILQSVSGNKKIIPIYIYGGLVGAVVFIATSYAIPQLKNEIEYSTMLGGNASIMAIAVATTVLAPNFRLFRMLNGGIPLWVLTLLYVIIDFAGSGGTAHHLAHLGGGLTGYLFIVSMKKGYDWSGWMNEVYAWFINLFNPDKNAAPKQSVKDKIFYNTGGRKPYLKKPVVTQQRI